MGISIKFYMRPRNLITGWFRWDPKEIQDEMRTFAEEKGYQCECKGRYLMIRLCPEGYVWVKRDNNRLKGESQTNIAGPGFHVAVLHFMEEMCEGIGIHLKVEDQTGYYRRRDFISMRVNCFYRWFTALMDLVSQWEEGKEDVVCWPSGYYVPEGRSGMVITHIRPFSYAEIRGVVNSGLSMAFAKDFFLWNEEEKDAYFYRNCGLALLNQECFFMPSSRSKQDQSINAEILWYLEKALDMDERIPFPKAEYLEVCGLAEHEPMDISHADTLPGIMEVGCRKKNIFRTLGVIIFGLPGNFIMDGNRFKGMDHYYDGKEYGGHDYYIYAVAARDKLRYKEPWFEQGIVAETYILDHGDIQAKAVVYEPQEEDGELRYNVSGQVLCLDQRTNIQISSRRPSETEWALDLVRNVRIADVELPTIEV